VRKLCRAFSVFNFQLYALFQKICELCRLGFRSVKKITRMSVKNQESFKRSAFSWFSEMRAIFSEKDAATSFSCFVLFAEKRMKRDKGTFVFLKLLLKTFVYNKKSVYFCTRLLSILRKQNI